jgi:hypothetical protein
LTFSKEEKRKKKRMEALTSYPVVLGVTGAAVAYLLLSKSSGPAPIVKPFVASRIATTTDELDKVIDNVAKNAQSWVNVSLARKLEYLKEMLALTQGVAKEASEASAQVRLLKDAAVSKELAGLFSAGFTASQLRGYIELYESLITTGAPPAVVKTRTVNDAQVATVAPRGLWQKITNPAVVEM